MTAIAHSTPPLLSKTAERRAQLADHERVIIERAISAGWRVHSAHVSQRRCSRYVTFVRPGSGKVVVRVSDHLPVTPINRRAQMLLDVISVPGSLAAVLAWLVRPYGAGVKGGAA